MCVNVQRTAEAYGWRVLEWIDVFKVGADTTDVKRTGCPTADWPDKGEERLGIGSCQQTFVQGPPVGKHASAHCTNAGIFRSC